jgi:hypothetical protein
VAQLLEVLRGDILSIILMEIIMNKSIFDESIFKSLSRYKPTKKKTSLENFTTQLFSWLLQYSIDNKTSLISYVINELFNNRKNSFKIVDKITTQRRFKLDNKRYVIPDITITISGKILYLIEVKVNSNFRNNQINDYKKIGKGKVYSITKFYNDSNELLNKEKIRWHSVSTILRKYTSNNKSEMFLVEQFATFLKEEGMEMNKIEKSLINGSKSLNYIINLIGDKLSDLSITAKGPKYEDEWIGYKSSPDAWIIGITLSHPEYISITTYNKSIMKKIIKSYGNDLMNEWDVDETYMNSYFIFDDQRLFSMNQLEQNNILHDWMKKKFRMMGIIK